MSSKYTADDILRELELVRQKSKQPIQTENTHTAPIIEPKPIVETAPKTPIKEASPIKSAESNVQVPQSPQTQVSVEDLLGDIKAGTKINDEDAFSSLFEDIAPKASSTNQTSTKTAIDFGKTAVIEEEAKAKPANDDFVGSDTMEFEKVKERKMGNFLNTFSIEDKADDIVNSTTSWTLDPKIIIDDNQPEPEEEIEEPTPKKLSIMSKIKKNVEVEANSNEHIDEDEEEIEYNSLEDEGEVHDFLIKSKNLAFMRLGVTTASFAALLYFAIANFVRIPLLPFMFPEDNMQMFLIANLAVLLISILSSATAIGNGLVSLVTLKGDSESAVAVSAITIFAHGIALIVNNHFITEGQGHFYFVVAALILFVSAIANYLNAVRVLDNFSIVLSQNAKKVFVTAETPEKAEAIVSPQEIENPEVIYAVNTSLPKGFMKNSFAKHVGVERYLIPAYIGVSLLISIFTFFTSGDVMKAFTYFTAIVAVAAPIGGIMIYAVPLYKVSQKLSSKGMAILGEKAVADMKHISALMLSGGDLYYGKNAPIYGIKPVVPELLNRAITDMASIAVSLNMPARQSLLNTINNDYALISNLESYQIIPEKGAIVQIEGRKVLMGNRALMQMYNISVPSEEQEANLKNGKKELLYITDSDRITAIFVVGYNPSHSVIAGLDKLERYGIGISISSADPNITAKRVSQDLDYDDTFVNLVDASATVYCEELYKEDSTRPSGIILSTQPSMLLKSFNTCFLIERGIKFATIIQAIALVFGFAATAFLAISDAINNLSFINIVIFQIITLIAVMLSITATKTE